MKQFLHPTRLKQKIVELSDSISFERQSRKGSNGWLFFGKNKIHNQAVAVKFYDWGGDAAYHAEPRNIAKLNSPNVISILDAAFVDENYAYFVTPYYTRGDLDEEISKGVLGNIRGINLVRDLLSGLSFLHAERLVHRDLKPQNILLTEDDHAVIGDFGSVKRLPEGQDTVPGTGHSLIYRPPESIGIASYGFQGDIYQAGIVLFQLLGGYLPYEETAWLNPRELKRYRQIADNIDRQIFAANIIKRRISRGQVINILTLPPWVSAPLRRTISKACNLRPEKRYQSCSDFLAKIAKIRPSIRDWRLEDGCPTIRNGTTYRIITDIKTKQYKVQKSRGTSWRYDNSFSGTTISELVGQIEGKAR